MKIFSLSGKHERVGVLAFAKITRAADGNSSREARSEDRDVEDHSLSKYDRVYNYQTKSTTPEERESRGSRPGITNAFTFGT